MRIALTLVSNRKAMRYRPFIMKIEGDKAEFIKAVIPHYRKGIFVGGEYEFEAGKYYIIRSDGSSHRIVRCYTTLYYFNGKELRKIASIDKVDGTLEFSDTTIKDIYVELKSQNTKNLIIQSLIEYAKRHSGNIDVDELIKREIEAFIEKLSKKYNVKIEINYKIIKQ